MELLHYKGNTLLSATCPQLNLHIISINYFAWWEPWSWSMFLLTFITVLNAKYI